MSRKAYKVFLTTPERTFLDSFSTYEEAKAYMKGYFRVWANLKPFSQLEFETVGPKKK